MKKLYDVCMRAPKYTFDLSKIAMKLSISVLAEIDNRVFVFGFSQN